MKENPQDVMPFDQSPDEDFFSIDEAALMMACSGPYVAMLVDRNHLPGSVKTPDGHRKIPKASVLAWMDNNPPHNDEDADYRSAAKEAGMYDIPEGALSGLLSSKIR